MQVKSYRALRHVVIRKKQAMNSSEVHHPDEKINQLEKFLKNEKNFRDLWDKKSLKILELFAGQGNLTKEYVKYGIVDAYDKRYLKTGDSYLVFHRLIAERKKYDLIDLDPYGFPNRFFPDIFLLIDKGALVITMPKPFVNILNGITQTHLISYFGKPNPDLETIILRIALWGLCHWRQVELLDVVDFGRIWRLFFKVKRVKSTDYTGVRNR